MKEQREKEEMSELSLLKDIACISLQTLFKIERR